MALGRALLALALLLAPFGIGQAAPVATLPICGADGGLRHLPDPAAPALPAHAHCDACLVAPPALPVPEPALRPPLPVPLAWAAASARRAAPPALPPEQARAPPCA
ncbi:hypothetical protein [Roseicella aquatilis]|uniref:hypothetical protein n=1 Tax=Roseicella aquatilis TaxID=2527868 RepID=UPI001404CB78|nr:hypothetical protein [Roseicella aquatilis]